MCMATCYVYLHCMIKTLFNETNDTTNRLARHAVIFLKFFFSICFMPCGQDQWTVATYKSVYSFLLIALFCRFCIVVYCKKSEMQKNVWIVKQAKAPNVTCSHVSKLSKLMTGTIVNTGVKMMVSHWPSC